MPFRDAVWRKSSFSNETECVEVARDRRVVGLRDSKNPGGGRLTVPAAAFQALRQAFVR
ncbi:hypothetical protein BLA60_40280 [Actinophytocola xinjiangensis]|uniref:DUF397 domain-containing protein n=1 Tax=Actinophytocola xinjiangensis TaxID=485602 RepID=A0A7Z0WD23_9PSEU|nr:DUF397 domain-containing protein [Actinophytocola xinjiangensis]OLF04531.1 hypothetical protein BLA60_40280 [Actinophytocola xinjiangensis]